jgi:sugar O-acyltransferase (sialic acid O-acetyltransferase NeuD family)
MRDLDRLPRRKLNEPAKCMIKKKLVIFGLNEIARLAFHYFNSEGKYELSAFSVDADYMNCKSLLGLPVVAAETLQANYPPDEALLFVGVSYGEMNQNRADIFKRMQQLGYHFASYLDPKASVVAPIIGENVFVMGSCTIEPSAEIGNNVIITPNVVISHDSKIKDHNYFCPAAFLCGQNVVEEYCVIGAGAMIAPRVHIGRGNFIGAGSQILSNTGENEAYLTGATPKSPRPAAFHERFSRRRSIS